MLRSLPRPLHIAPFVTLLLAACASAPPEPATPPPRPAPAATASPPARTAAIATPPVVRGPATTAPATPSAVVSPPELARRIDAVLAQPRFAGADWGIDVVSLRDGRTLYSHHAGRRFIPASNAKLYTAALALDTFGPRHRFATRLYATAHPSRGVLHGDVILYGGGDPSLGSGDDAHAPTAWADRLATALAARGVGRITGDIVADATAYAGPPVGAGWEANDLQSWFAPQTSALSVGGNVFVVRVDARGGCCQVTTTPGAADVAVDNLTRTVAAGEREDLGLYRTPGSSLLHVYGGLHANAGSRRFVLASPDPARMAGELLRDALVRRGIRLDGRVRALQWPRTGVVGGPASLVRITDVRSAPLSDLVEHMLKHSDNLYAQMLLLAVGEHARKRGACSDRLRSPDWTADWGLCAMRAFTRRIGIDSGAALFEEGSGLSRKDLVTPAATTRLLAWAARQRFASAFRDALPVAGVDGTLRHRLRGTPAEANLTAKTGTLRYAYALSGYVTSTDGEPLAFSIMLNDYARPVDGSGRPTVPSARHDVDAVAAAIAGYPGPVGTP